MTATFELLHQKVQKYIYSEKWPSFRPIQDDAIQVLTQSDSHLLISAPTASGKTEAAFLPIVSQLADDYGGSFRAVYISPLKALINDQFRRIDRMCEHIGIPVTKWHGDVAQGKKSAAAKDPAGILLITPESLEAILLLKGPLIGTLFKKLKWVVIDEIHSFVGVERGAQLRSILARIEAEAGVSTTRIGLSATIGNPEAVAQWMVNRGDVAIIQDKDWDESGVEGMIHGFCGSGLDPLDSSEVEDGETSPRLIESLCASFRSGKNLIFGNSKRKLEEVCLKTSTLSHERGFKTSFLIHHGSLSKEIRETAEATIKGTSGDTSVFCTSTLEMGIDIGAVERIGILDPPWSVSSFAQRVGRSGRRSGTNKKFEFFVQQDALNAESRLSELLREDLVKSIAVTLLYLEGFKEPLETQGVHASTLVHQLLSFSGQKLGISKHQLGDTVLSQGFRDAVSRSELDQLISHLVQVGILYMDSQGAILPGKIGERLIEHYEFYAVFASSEQWGVVCDGTEIGTIPVIQIYRPNDRLLLGGRLWSVVEVNDQSKRLIVVPAKKAKAPLFEASYGITHARIHEKMREIFESGASYPFIDTGAMELLAEARSNYKLYVLSRPEARTIFPIFEGNILQNTVRLGLQALDLEFGLTECCLQLEHPQDGWFTRLFDHLNHFPDATSFVSELKRSSKQTQKYDGFLPDWLLDRVYAEARIDLEGAKKWVQRLIEGTEVS